MLSSSVKPSSSSSSDSQYTLQAVITHYGRHENGHYICYRKTPGSDQWWRISDEDVWKVSEAEVKAQGGVFMLFYELAVMQDNLERGGKPMSSAQKELTMEDNDNQQHESQDLQQLPKPGQTASSASAKESIEMSDVD